MSAQQLKSTPLINEHRALGAKLAPFSGWLMPIQYSGIIAEHNWTRSACSLFDICHMGEFMVYGAPEKNGLDRIVTCDIRNTQDLSCHYGFMLNEKGVIVDDLIVYKIKQDKCMLVVNAATTEDDEAHLRSNLSRDAKLDNISDMAAKLDLQGPISGEVLANIIGPEIKRLEYYTFGIFSIFGEDNIVSRTGYTGERGYEIYTGSDKVKELWLTLLKDQRVKPAGLGARDTLRLEMGYLLYGQDMDEDTSPIEADLERFVDYNKDFIGKDALLKKKRQGISEKLVYFITDSRRSPRHGHKIYFSDKEIGIVTSGSFAPSLSRSVGIGYVQPDYAELGREIIIKADNADIEATITAKPFYKKGTAKIRPRHCEE